MMTDVMTIIRNLPEKTTPTPDVRCYREPFL